MKPEQHTAPSLPARLKEACTRLSQSVMSFFSSEAPQSEDACLHEVLFEVRGEKFHIDFLNELYSHINLLRRIGYQVQEKQLTEETPTGCMARVSYFDAGRLTRQELLMKQEARVVKRTLGRKTIFQTVDQALVADLYSKDIPSIVIFPVNNAKNS